MSDPVLYIIRGLPGSGKTTLARKLVAHGRHFEADMFMVDDSGQYMFQPEKLSHCHRSCKQHTEAAMSMEAADVAVSNTFSQMWEYQDYLDLADRYGYAVQVVECSGSWDSEHSVPSSVIERMRDRWEPHDSTEQRRKMAVVE